MKKVFLLAVVLSSFAALGMARAGGAPDITGIWAGDYPVFFQDGSGHARMSLDIKHQSGEGFSGHMDWKRLDFTPYPNATPDEAFKHKKTYGREHIVGVIDFDGQAIEISSPEDTGVLHGHIVGKNKMRLTFSSRSNPAVVFRAELTRVAH
jgi:hypothetical protein